LILRERKSGVDPGGSSAKGDWWIERLEMVPGTGPVTAFMFSAFADRERFENGAQVGNYLYLTPRVYMSGNLIRYGGITKRRTGYLWALVRPKDGCALKERFEYMTKEKGTEKKKAIMAAARRLGALLKNGTIYEARRFRPGKPADVKTLVQEALSA
jgi:transposase